MYRSLTNKSIYLKWNWCLFANFYVWAKTDGWFLTHKRNDRKQCDKIGWFIPIVPKLYKFWAILKRGQNRLFLVMVTFAIFCNFLLTLDNFLLKLTGHPDHHKLFSLPSATFPLKQYHSNYQAKKKWQFFVSYNGRNDSANKTSWWFIFNYFLQCCYSASQCR